MAGNDGGDRPFTGTETGRRADSAAGAGAFLSVHFDAVRIRLLVGFASFVAWVNLLICFEGLLRDTVAYGGGVVRDPLFVAAMLVAGVVLIVAATCAPRVLAEKGLSPRGITRGLALLGVLGGASGVVGVALSALAISNTTAVWAAATALGCMAGLFVAAYTRSEERRVGKEC